MEQPKNRTAVKIDCTLYTLAEVQIMLLALTRICEHQLRQKPYPALYESGVVYQREPHGRERWQTVKETLRLGYGDCEDLAAWRAAELRARGIDRGAIAMLKRVRPGLIHCVVRRSDGQIEDPSKRLGMRGKG